MLSTISEDVTEAHPRLVKRCATYLSVLSLYKARGNCDVVGSFPYEFGGYIAASFSKLVDALVYELKFYDILASGVLLLAWKAELAPAETFESTTLCNQLQPCGNVALN